MHPKIRELDTLLRQVERPENGPHRTPVSTGCGPLDVVLPGRGFWRGSLVEWLGNGPGCGVGMLALWAAREACREGGALVVVDPQDHFYPPAAAAGGVDLANTIVVRGARCRQVQEAARQSEWALDQALRCPHVAAVIAWPQRLDSRVFRRWQLAVEASGCLGLLIRSAEAKREASWADVRLLVSPERTIGPAPRAMKWRLQVEVLRCRGGVQQRTVGLEIDERTGDIHATHPGGLAT